MKQKIIIISAIILLLALVAFMVKDFFFSRPDNSNPYALDVEKIRNGDTAAIAFAETLQIKTSLEEIHGLATDANGRIYVSGKDGVEIFDASGKPETKFNIQGTAQCISPDEKGNLLPDSETPIISLISLNMRSS